MDLFILIFTRDNEVHYLFFVHIHIEIAMFSRGLQIINQINDRNAGRYFIIHYCFNILDAKFLINIAMAGISNASNI